MTTMIQLLATMIRPQAGAEWRARLMLTSGAEVAVLEGVIRIETVLHEIVITITIDEATIVDEAEGVTRLPRFLTTFR